MGQRHQLFLIAKVNNRYRTLAALHQQWSYEALAIKRCGSVLKVLKANGSALRRDVRKAERLDWVEVEAKSLDKRMMWENRDELTTLFPYAATCLMVAAGDKLLEPNSILPTQCDNNDGITVFDITDPDKPRYCFVSLPSSEHDEEVEHMVPMSASEYMDIYQEEIRDKDLLAELLQEVESFPLIDAATLHSAWPELEFHDNDRHTADAPDEVTNQEIGSLRGRTMREVIMQGPDSDPSDLSWFEEATQLPDFIRMVRETLLAQPELLEKQSGFVILKLSLQGQREIDLSSFSTLRPSQAVDIVEGMDQKIILSLPDIADLDIEDFEALLHTGRLREVHMGETPKLTLQKALDAILGKRLDAFTHPRMYHMALELMCTKPRGIDQSLPKYPNGEGTGFPMSQVIFIRHLYSTESLTPPRLNDGSGMAWTKTVQNPRSEMTPSKFMCNADEEPSIMPLELTGSLMTLDQALVQLCGAVAEMAKTDTFGLARSFGMPKVGQDVATKHLALRDDNRVAPIPAELYNVYRTFGMSNFERPPNPAPLRHGEWTLLMLHGWTFDFRTDSSTLWSLRYAFVTLDESEKLKCFPVHDFEKALLSNAIYQPYDAAVRAELVESFERRLKRDIEIQDAEVSFCGLQETAETLQMVDIYRADVERSDEVEGRIRQSVRARRLYLDMMNDVSTRALCRTGTQLEGGL